MKTTAPLALLVVAGSAVAQPANDNCSNAAVISGFPTIAFDNTLATTDGLPNTLCISAGQAGIERDLWYRWSAPTYHPVRLTTCGLTGVNTKIAVYFCGYQCSC